MIDIEVELLKAIFLNSGTLFSHTKYKIVPFATTWMELEGVMLSEISQIEKDNLCMTPLL